MIQHTRPMLYGADEFAPGVDINKKFKTYGYGFIDSIVESTITKETNEYSLELDVLGSCNVGGELRKYNLIVANGDVFRIEDTEYKSEDGVINVYAKHISYDLNFDSVYNKKYKSKTFEYIIKDIYASNQYKNFNITFNLGRFKSHTIADEFEVEGKAWEEIENVIEKFIESVAETGTVIEIDIKRELNNIHFQLYEANKDYTSSTYKDSKGAGKDTGIRIDKIIENVEIVENDSDFCTKVIALGKDDKVVKDITHPNIGKNGLPFWIVDVVSFSDESDTAKLRKLGQSHIITKSINIKNIKVELGDIVGTDFFRKITSYSELDLYDFVWIKHPSISDTYVSFRVSLIERDIEGRLKALEFGEANNDFVKTLKKTMKKIATTTVVNKLKATTTML